MSRWIDIDDYRNCYIGNDGEYERWNIDPDVLDEAKPTVESERKRGRWELAEDGWYCSSCKLYPPFDCDPEEKGIPFCPNCGAEMRGEEG